MYYHIRLKLVDAYSWLSFTLEQVAFQCDTTTRMHEQVQSQKKHILKISLQGSKTHDKIDLSKNQCILVHFYSTQALFKPRHLWIHFLSSAFMIVRILSLPHFKERCWRAFSYSCTNNLHCNKTETHSYICTHIYGL